MVVRCRKMNERYVEKLSGEEIRKKKERKKQVKLKQRYKHTEKRSRRGRQNDSDNMAEIKYHSS